VKKRLIAKGGWVKMKKATYWFLTLLIVISAAYLFYNHVIHNTYRGTIIQIDEDYNILVATDTSIQIEDELSDEEIQTYRNHSIWFYTSDEQIENIQLGDNVKVRAGNAVDESLPPRMDATQIKK